MLQIPKEYEAYSDIPTYEPFSEFYNSEYAAFDLVDLLGYSKLLSDIHEVSLINNTNDELACENATLSSLIALEQERVKPEQIQIVSLGESEDGFERIKLEADFSGIYEAVNSAIRDCNSEAEIITLDDVEFWREAQNLRIFVNNQEKYSIKLLSRKFEDRLSAPSVNLLPYNSPRVSFVLATNICKSRPTIIESELKPYPLSKYAIPPESSVSICTAVASAYLEDQSSLDKVLNFHSISTYAEAYKNQYLVLPEQTLVIEFMETHNPGVAEDLKSGEMQYSILAQECPDDESVNCQLYQILIDVF